MKGRYCFAIIISTVALFFASITGLAENASKSPQSTAKPKSSKRSSQQTPKPNASHVYVIRKGDSLNSIARAFKTTPKELISLNNLSSSKIKIGQKIKVPGAPAAAAVSRPKKTEPKADANEPFMSAATSQQRAQDETQNTDPQTMRYRLVEAGFKWIGVRYRFSGTSEESGVDCSGLVMSLFSKFNIELPRSSKEQFKQGEKVDRDKLDVGDLVFFSSGGNLPTHVGIYVGNDKILHAASKAKQVMVSDLSKFWHSMRYLGARRIMDLWWEEPAAPAPEKE
jgi:peptidoglycan DL-endopeptidase LytE